MTRSVNTLATVVITLVALLVFGGGSLQNFAFALLVGICSGGYHSIFYSAPLSSGCGTGSLNVPNGARLGPLPGPDSKRAPSPKPAPRRRVPRSSARRSLPRAAIARRRRSSTRHAPHSSRGAPAVTESAGPTPPYPRPVREHRHPRHSSRTIRISRRRRKSIRSMRNKRACTMKPLNLAMRRSH